MRTTSHSSPLAFFRTAMLVGAFVVFPGLGDGPPVAAPVEDLFPSALPVLPALPSVSAPVCVAPTPTLVIGAARTTAAVVITTSVDTFVNATVVSAESGLPVLAVDILKDVSVLLLDHAIVYCYVLAVSAVAVFFVYVRRIMADAPRWLGVCSSTLDACRRRFVSRICDVLNNVSRYILSPSHG